MCSQRRIREEPCWICSVDIFHQRNSNIVGGRKVILCQHLNYTNFSVRSLNVLHPDTQKLVAPVELCPILKTLYKILITRDSSTEAILQALRDENLNDPRERIEIAQSHAFYRPSLLGQP
ncbi:hypothetical protein ACFE04_013008 [Oxalis oulophora]